MLQKIKQGKNRKKLKKKQKTRAIAEQTEYVDLTINELKRNRVDSKRKYNKNGPSNIIMTKNALNDCYSSIAPQKDWEQHRTHVKGRLLGR